ncbi:uncharacterized protein si:ch211-142k18.1 isoform X1 [Coregonus clupeaformis]|uniref:uncharacterized protein si:ch211-142k18.1 isoform X1 n=1 Tax=Coregonus clupeaformis TaxID=59861 RepID=UPI001BDF838A|nr:uncharacterized protein si:ch211-142k18.1 isoform X1 [Coregonus clupeaformis]
MGHWWCWLLATLLWVSTITTPCLGQSGDSADWGSGFDISMTTLGTNNNTSSSQEPGDYPAGSETETGESWVKTPPPTSPPPPPKPVLHYEPEPDECSVHFSTSQASARRLKAQREELAYLKAIQHGNQAVVENLVQYVGAELGEGQRYEDVIEENIVGIREEQQSCNGVVQKVVEDLDGQLEGDVLEALAGILKIKEESLAFEGLLQATADIAMRLDSLSQTLHASFTKQLKDSQNLTSLKRLTTLHR